MHLIKTLGGIFMRPKTLTTVQLGLFAIHIKLRGHMSTYHFAHPVFWRKIKLCLWVLVLQKTTVDIQWWQGRQLWTHALFLKSPVSLCVEMCMLANSLYWWFCQPWSNLALDEAFRCRGSCTTAVPRSPVGKMEMFEDLVLVVKFYLAVMIC